MTRRDQILALQRADPSITQAEAAEVLGVSRQNVHSVCRRYGISLNDGRFKRRSRVANILGEIADLRADIERMKQDIEVLKEAKNG